MDLKAFLVGVDGTEKFVEKALQALDKNDITVLHELKKCDADVIRKNVASMTGGLHGFLDRAIEKY